jgi:hypothetical protein
VLKKPFSFSPAPPSRAIDWFVVFWPVCLPFPKGYAVVARVFDKDGFKGLPGGYLLKKAEHALSGNRWQKRYFRVRKVLHSDRPAEYVLDYFSDQSAATARGTVKLEGVLVSTAVSALVFEVRSLHSAHVVRLKTNTPKLRWQWAHALHKLTLTRDPATVAKEMAEGRRIQESFAHGGDGGAGAGVGLRGSSLEEKRAPKGSTWKDMAGRHGGGESFKLSDLGRVALNKLKQRRANSDKSSDMARVSQQHRQLGLGAVASGAYLSVQILAARGLKSAQTKVRVTLITANGTRYEAGTSEHATGREPIYEAADETLVKGRQLHNLLALLPQHESTAEKLRELSVCAEVIDTRVLGGGCVGECVVSLRDKKPREIFSNWMKLYPLDKVFCFPFACATHASAKLASARGVGITSVFASTCPQPRGDLRLAVYFELERKHDPKDEGSSPVVDRC